MLRESLDGCALGVDDELTAAVAVGRLAGMSWSRARVDASSATTAPATAIARNATERRKRLEKPISETLVFNCRRREHPCLDYKLSIGW
jgi:hypothetical protein